MLNLMVGVQTNRLLNTEFKRKVFSMFVLVLFITFLISITAAPVFGVAADENPKGVDQLYKIVNWIAGWAAKIGLVVAFFGAIQTVLGFMNDDADAKVRGLKTMAAGFMVWGISMSVDMFFETSGTN
jgi:uncharacterized membrane protein YfcA